MHATAENAADGMIITSCLPMTINMVIVLTIAAGGSEASAVFNGMSEKKAKIFLNLFVCFRSACEERTFACF